MEDVWNQRYSANEFAYGEEPNEFLKSQLAPLTAGTILFPAEGEGRNAVHAAKNGWAVSAFDQSAAGKTKALQLAAKNRVTIDYFVGDFHHAGYKAGQFDAIAFIYAHFPAHLKSNFNRELAASVRSGGTVIFEAFSKKHLPYVTSNPAVGGPKDIDMLFSAEEIGNDFADFDIITLTETEVELHEGVYHNGLGCVIRFVGRKR